ncbi:MAG TPA: aminopeptidase P family protein [Solirubrobacterales bacterium]|nr:aminopeptidase P family protein [Solirubrobacterales bacterium]
MASEERAERLGARIAERGIDALIVGDLVHPGDSGRDAIADVSWLSGFTGSSGLALVDAGGACTFITDFRYAERAGAELPDGFELVIADRNLVETLADRLEGRVGFDPQATSVRELRRLRDGAPDGVELLEDEGAVGGLRRVKDAAEIEAIAAASELTDAVYAELEEAGLGGRSERDIGLWIERRMRELGASGPAFPPIVAAGPNGSLPHAEPGDRVIAAGDLVVVDIGAILDGYCSDCTRTYACGEVGDEEREVYGLVLAAQLAALDGLRAGASGRAVDALARDHIAAGGHGERFGHGLGHGVGIAVHEPPRLSKRSEDQLLAGDVVTVEPGVYVPGRFGIRIEDLAVVTDDGHRNLSSRPKQLLELS